MALNVDSETSTSTSHLYIPAPELSESPIPSSSSSRAPQLLKDRLYIGNLHPSVNEYTLLQVFSKFGKVSKLDFLFHKAGPNRGKPRGYAFVEYLDPTDAAKALEGTNDKLLRGRKLVVTHAQQASLDQMGASSKSRKADNRPTTLSIMKSGHGHRSEGTSSKIAMMEAKLRQMERTSSTSQRALPNKPVASLLPLPGTTRAAKAPRHAGQFPPSIQHPSFLGSQSPPAGLAEMRKSQQAPSTIPVAGAETSLQTLSPGPRMDLSKGSKHSSQKHSLSGVKILKGGNR
ncbi:RNA-binding domain-containing protein [Leucogyrophana mollusca]|uniref:RNA-binding domain-containing protein n=1 Tax=Leucogyrophana mollusca TaxID=85980 RepID=A0ACB8B443_9AGAM|nr:RNA-binding domain-containing protein [Leucogyrophana mollusca]